MGKTKWRTFAEAVAEVHGSENRHLVTALNVVKTRPCPAPSWDADRTYRVALVGRTPVIQRLAEDNTWETAPLQPTEDHMTETEKKLKRLRDQLSATDSWPWSSFKAWVASAKPLMKRAYGEFLDDFNEITADPSWLMLPRFASGGSEWTGEPPRDNFAEASAKEDEANRKLAEQTKINTLQFLDGLLDLPAADHQPQRAGGAGASRGPTITASGDVVFGPKSETSFSDSPVGAAATAPGAIASGHLSMEGLREEVARVQAALVTDQDKLDGLHELLHDALSQLLRSVRKTEFEQADQTRIVAQIKESVDDIWVKHQLGNMTLPAGSDVAKAILASPVLAAALKGIIAAV